MTSIAGDAPQEQSLFVRKATGLVKGWSVRDAFIYSAFSINIVTLGLYAFSYGPFIPKGSLLWAVILSGAYLVFQAITYASLIAAMPRAGGDYVWMSRVLGGGIGFVIAVCGWWFILWHWVPIYANVLNGEVFGPLAAIVGWNGAVTFFAEPKGLFASSIFVAVAASVLIGLGMRTYARFQKFCFYGGVIALAIVVLLLLIHTKGEFHTAFNNETHRFYGTQGDAYAATLKAGNAHVAGIGSLAIGSTILLIPFLFFFNLWSNWGATLYGEVRGASDFKKNIKAMGGALLATSAVGVILLLLFAKTFGWQWYNAANNAYWSGNSPLGGNFPYPGLFAAFFFHNRVLEFAVVALMSLWFFGWMGSIFLSSTRVVFATAFDRVLPEWTAKVSTNGVPYAALALMLVPSIPISYLYAYNSNFSTWTLDATLVIAITFLGSAIAAAILPWRKPEIYNASPIAKYKVLGLPLITFSAIGFMIILVFALYKWFQDDVYGVNNTSSLWYMLALYGIALAIYVISRVYRRTQGVDLGIVYKEIPSE